MFRNWFEENRLLIIVTGVLFLCLVIGWILYALFGHQLIEAMYEGRSIGFLNRIIEGQATNPVELYFEMADRLFCAYSLGFAMSIVFIYALRKISIKNFSQSETAQETQFFSPLLRLLIIGFLFVMAFGIRAYRINEPPLDFSPARQYRSAIITRGYYFETAKSIPEWKRHVARINKQKEGIIEPPIMERIAFFTYCVAGGEYLWIPRVLSSIFWLIGGAFLYLIAKKLVSTDAAVFSTAFYLFLPFGIEASRSFQPDPLMVMMLLFAIFTILRYYDQPSTLGWMIATTVSTSAILIKPVCLFLIFAAFVSIAIYKQGIRRTVISPKFLLFIVISLLPTILFYSYGIFTAGILRLQARRSFLPYLLLYPFFWKGWFSLIGKVVGHTALIGALLGVLMFRKGLPRALMIGLWSGYFIFGLVFTYHIHTHDYYQLQFIPIIALSLGPIGALVMSHLRQICKRWYGYTALFLGIIFLVTPINMHILMRDFSCQKFERRVRIAQEIGKDVNHSTKTIFLSEAFGNVLVYYGELSGKKWPRRSGHRAAKLFWGLPQMSVEERFNILSLNYSPEYFIVTDLREFEVQEDLKNFLTREFSIAVQNNNYLIFDLRKDTGGQEK